MFSPGYFTGLAFILVSVIDHRLILYVELKTEFCFSV